MDLENVKQNINKKLKSIKPVSLKATNKAKRKESRKSKQPLSTTVKQKLKKTFVVDQPKTAQQFAATLFQDIDTKYDIFQIADDEYSFCMEYSDISFSKASKESQVNTFTSWVDYLNSFTEKTHIQVVNFGKAVKTDEYKHSYMFNEQSENVSLQKIAKELNQRISLNIGDSDNTLINKRYLVVSQKARSIKEAKEQFIDILNRTEEKFKHMLSNIRIVPYTERLNLIYDLLNVDTAADHDFVNLLEKAHKEDKTIYDVLVPKHKEAISFKEKDYVSILGKKYLQVLYIQKYPKSLSPAFYHKITSQEMNIITTLNIQPTNNAKAIKKVDKKISGMDTERLEKSKRLAKNGISYTDCPDRKLDRKIEDGEQLQEDIRKNKQKIFTNNMLICIIADSLSELDNNAKVLTEIAAEHFVELRPILWQQLEGIKHVLPLGHNHIQFQRTLTSEATGVNVPFDSKDLIQPNGLYYGQNLNTRKCLFADRKALMNGNGAVLATSGAGKSFTMKLLMEQIKVKYPDDDIIVVEPQKEYDPLVKACHGETITISANSSTHINPFDLDMHYSLSDTDDSIETDPVKEKIDYILSFIESILEEPLNSTDKTLIDRCCTIIYKPYVKSGFQNESLIPNLKHFYEKMKQQPEPEAEKIALALERYVHGSITMFSQETNINIKNKFICFDISNLSKSLQTTGYLLVLDHIMNRLAKNQHEGRFTWIFIDEFHILLRNLYSAEYIAKIYKVGRKLHALPTICTQNISNVLQSDYGCDILSNSESAIILKQKALDLQILSNIFNISDDEKEYVTNSPSGHGLLIYGEDCYPFKNEIPDSYYIYELNETSSLHKARA